MTFRHKSFLQVVVGLEIHVELKTKSKMFCSCFNSPFQEEANLNICPVCLGYPGTLPVINEEAVKKVIKTGLALHCQISEYSKFDRKNYFYPDLPKGYQISQYDQPLCRKGHLEIGGKKIGIERIHLEEDTGRLVHPVRKPEDSKKADYSLVDFNRAGVPLMELVTEPDLGSAKEARKFAQTFQLILRYLDVSNADMEKGQFRCEVNLSLKKPESKKLGTKVEIKNLNSFRVVEDAINYEIKRQSQVLKSGQKVTQETRGWLDSERITQSQRIKEGAEDYRYFPEPDLPSLYFINEDIRKIGREIPELPNQREKRLKKEYQLEDKEAEILVRNKDFGEYFEKAMSELRNWVKVVEEKTEIDKKEFLKLTRLATHYLISDLQGLLKKSSITDENFLITPENFAEFITLIYEGKISSKIAKEVLGEMFSTGADPSHIIKEKRLTQISDQVELEKVIKEIIARNQKAVDDFYQGKTNAFQFLVGQIMARTKGKANPDLVNKILRKLL